MVGRMQECRIEFLNLFTIRIACELMSVETLMSVLVRGSQYADKEQKGKEI